MNDLYLSDLNIEITRRCNMNCIHCAKGQAENLDISKDIIDKTMSELQNTYIHYLYITGGEPFINIEGLTETINSIIQNKIKVYKVIMFTNATIKDIRIVNAIQKLADYIKRMKPLFEHDTNKYLKKFISTIYHYNNVSDKDVVVISSTNYHKNNDSVINETINYYNTKINRNNFIALSQNDDVYLDDFNINFEGNVIKNYKSLPVKALRRIRLVDNNYCIIDDSTPDTILINKGITISANGNVFVGNLSSYIKVDNEIKMFNVMACNNNFYNMLSDWCWLYPINEKIHLTKERYNTFLWQQNEKILCDRDIAIAFSKINIQKGIMHCENMLKQLHEEHPTLNHSEINKAFNCLLLLDIKDNNDLEKELILELFSSFDTVDCKKIINDYDHAAKIAMITLFSLYNK